MAAWVCRIWSGADPGAEALSDVPEEARLQAGPTAGSLVSPGPPENGLLPSKRLQLTGRPAQWSVPEPKPSDHVVTEQKRHQPVDGQGRCAVLLSR